MPEPSLLDAVPFVPHAYEAILKSGTFTRAETSPERYASVVGELEAMTDRRLLRIRYKSGGLVITGLMVEPVALKQKAHPLIIYNRGGNLEFSKLTALTALRTLIPLSRMNDAVVLASNYRGNDGSEGREEYGGADVGDVMALLAIGRSLPAFDGRRSLMVGHSRGGMMTALALKHGAEVNAAVMSASVSDLEASSRERPDLEKMFGSLIPGFTECREEVLRERSAIHWPEMLRVPMLLLHGDADRRVSAGQSIRFAEALKTAGHPHELVVYPGDDHGMSRNWPDALARMNAWLKRYSPAQ